MILEDRLASARDDAYAALIAAHDGLSTDQSHALNARLVLIMMNEIGDIDRLHTLLAAAQEEHL